MQKQKDILYDSHLFSLIKYYVLMKTVLNFSIKKNKKVLNLI